MFEPIQLNLPLSLMYWLKQGDGINIFPLDIITLYKRIGQLRAATPDVLTSSTEYKQESP
ncbi:hypothetical protein DX930_30405 [Bacillus cereus]|nr:hypothetical protein DX930_30405 [Bacillus cereus]